MTRSLFAAIVLGLFPSSRDSPADDASARLKAILDEHWEFRLKEDPLFAPRIGDRLYADRLPAVAPGDFGRRTAVTKRLRERLRALDRTALAPAERVDYDILARILDDDLTELEFRTWRMPLTAEGSYHSSFARLPSTMPLETTRDYQGYLARLRAFPAYGR